MVSSKSLAWTCLLVQLVLSSACLLASLAAIAAKLQSVSIYEDKQYISSEWWIFSLLSFLMIWATIFAMLGLSGHKKTYLFPHILLLVIFCLFVGRVLLRVAAEFEFTELNYLVGGSALSFSVTTGNSDALTQQTYPALILCDSLKITTKKIQKTKNENSTMHIYTGSLSNEPSSQRHSKLPLTILIVIQLFVAVYSFGSVTKPLIDHGEHIQTVPKGIFHAAIVLCPLWLITLATSISGIITNRRRLLLPHLILNAFLTPLVVVMTICLAIDLIGSGITSNEIQSSNTDSRSLVLIYLATSFLLIFTIIQELKCYKLFAQSF